MERETGREGVSRAEFEAFKKAFLKEVGDMKDMVCAIAKELQEPKQVGIYRCDEKGCTFETDDLGAYVEHKIDERVKGLVPTEETVWGEEKPKTHSTVRDYLDCDECFPKFADAMLEHPTFQKKLEEMGYIKEEPKRESGFPALNI